MILTQLETLEFPHLPGRQLLRRLAHARKQARRIIKSQIRQAGRKSKAIIQRQYFITQAYGDAQKAIRHNEDIYLASVMAVFGVCFSAAMVAFELFMLFLQTAYDLSALTGISMPALTVIALSVLTILGGWVASFLLNTLSLTIMDGANRKVHRSVRGTFRAALRQASHVAGAWIMLGAVVLGPLAYAMFAIGMYASLHGISLEDVLRLLPYGVTAALSWVIFMLMQYSLVPWVALFEPGTRLRDTFARSRKLLSRRGHLFVLFGHMIITTALIGFYELAGIINSVLGIGKEPLFATGAIALAILANGMIVSLYRKRKLARKA